MRIRVKIREGVSRGLCGSCREAHIMTDANGYQEVHCTAMPNATLLVKRVIAECSNHRGINHMTEWEAKQQGWILEVKGSRVVGFKAPDKEGDI